MRFRIGINVGDVMVEGDDLYGDGVNIAARLEGISDAGGICISGSTYDQVRGKLSVGIKDIGPQQVKNIAEPVAAYRVLPGATPVAVARNWRIPVLAAALAVLAVAGALAWWQPWAGKVETANVQKMAFPLPTKPSIAVLPFKNMSDNSEQEYFADGMTEDLITDLSQLSGLFVISRNSTFTYKGETVEPRQVAEELGVRYILQGSVRRAEGQVRVNAQLIDATTGGYLWADRYDDQLDNIFALQDRITNKIFAALAVQLSAGEKANLGREETQNIEAYDAFLKGWELYRKWTPDGFREALPFFHKAIELDPKYGRAHAAIASIYTEGYVKAWDWSHVVGVSAEAMPGLAGKYLKEALKYPTPLAHLVATKWYVILQFPEEAIAEAARGITLDPNDPVGYSAMATALIYAGKPGEAIDFINKAIRFDPHNMPNYLFTMGMANFGMEQFERAVTDFERAFELNPKLGLVQRAYLAAAYMHLGQQEQAVTQLDNPEIKEVRDLYDLYVKYEAAYYQNDQDKFRLVGVLNQIEF
jgi:adenylate cyclase